MLLLLGVQMAGTLMPLVLFPSEVFIRIHFAPTLEGQYIIKNAVLISASIVLAPPCAAAAPRRVTQAVANRRLARASEGPHPRAAPEPAYRAGIREMDHPVYPISPHATSNGNGRNRDHRVYDVTC